MFLRFKDDETVARSDHYDEWGCPYLLTNEQRKRMRDGHRFVRRCYYVLVTLFVLTIGVLVHLSCAL